MAQADHLQEEPLSKPTTDTSFRFKVVVRKRPLLPYELKQGDLDIISNNVETMRVHECKLKVDGISRVCQPHDFQADCCYGDQIKTD